MNTNAQIDANNARVFTSLAARMDAEKARRFAIAADMAELRKLDLKAATLAADIELEGKGSDNLPALRAMQAAAEDARQDALARIYGGTTKGRDERRAVQHAVNHMNARGIDAEQRRELHAALVDGCTRAKWGRDVTAHVRLPREVGFVTEREFTRYEFRMGNGVEVGTIAPYVPTVPFGPDTLNVTQDGTPVVVDGQQVAERDGSRDEACDAARKQATTRVAMASREKDANQLQQHGYTGLQAHIEATLLLEAQDVLDREAAKAEASALRMDAMLAEEQEKAARTAVGGWV